MPTNKQKRRLRNRQRVADRQPTKAQQIQALMKKLDKIAPEPESRCPFEQSVTKGDS